MREQVFPFLNDSKYRAVTVLSRLYPMSQNASKYLSSTIVWQVLSR